VVARDQKTEVKRRAGYVICRVYVEITKTESGRSSNELDGNICRCRICLKIISESRMLRGGT
jgi:hypothetical protein